MRGLCMMDIKIIEERGGMNEIWIGDVGMDKFRFIQIAHTCL